MPGFQPEYRVTITITRYSEPDAVIAQSLRHALDQQGVSGEVLFFEQDPESLLSVESSNPRLVLRTIRKRLNGLSEARNLALEEARHPLVLFLDADALADQDWASHLCTALSNEGCAVAGSKVIPAWPGKAPFFTTSNALRDQYSLLDLGEGTRPYHRVIGAGFAIDTAKLRGLRFDTTLGRRGGVLFGGEESDFCKRAYALGFDVVYVGGARIRHLIEPSRCRWRWILKRMVYAGHGRARLGGAPRSSGKACLYDWLFMPIYLPFYALGWFWGKIAAMAHAPPDQSDRNDSKGAPRRDGR